MKNDIFWIKLSTSMFDDEKIILIEQLPDGDTILLIWIKILIQAGRSNAEGYLKMNDASYNDEMLAVVFRKPLAVVQKAFEVLKRFKMLEIKNGAYLVRNWKKYQNMVPAQKKIRESFMARERMKRYRERKNGKIETFTPQLIERFETLYASYPLKSGKAEALKIFNKINPDDTLFSQMATKIEKAKKSHGWIKDNGKWIPSLKTWLRDQGWLNNYTCLEERRHCDECKEPIVGSSHDREGKRICSLCNYKRPRG